MTQVTSREVTCPHCNTTQETDVYTTLNVTVDVEKKKDLFDGKINVLQCSNCDEKTAISTTFLYHDMTLKVAVYCYSPQALGDANFLKQFNVDGTLRMQSVLPEELQGGQMDYLTKHPHIVFNMQELMAYVYFREKLYEAHSQ